MPLSHYETKHYSEDGLLYVVVTLDDGSTFGQYITPSTQEAMDAEVVGHVSRYEAQLTPKPQPQLGVVRTAAAMQVVKEIA